MLSFDIETEGLSSAKHRITVASVYDPCRGIQRTYNFVSTDDPAEIQRRIQSFLQDLDDAPALCCFNGVKFDIPFIAERFLVPPTRVHGWMLKLFDIFEVCRLVYGSSCSLNNLLLANGSKQVKSSSGLQAVEWARQGEWQLLEDYCMQDTVLTHQISCRGGTVKLPLSWKRGGGNVQAQMRHEYCSETNRHLVLEFECKEEEEASAMH